MLTHKVKYLITDADKDTFKGDLRVRGVDCIDVSRKVLKRLKNDYTLKEPVYYTLDIEL